MKLITETGSHSTRFKKIYKIAELIVNTLDDDIEFKRLMVYPTKNPLEEIGVGYNGKLYTQKDIDKSLTKKNSFKVSDEFKLVTEPSLYNGEWMREKIPENYPTAFVYPTSCTGSSPIITYSYMIDLIVPEAYLDLFYSDRPTELMVRVADLLEGATVDEEARKEIGNIDIKIGTVYRGKMTRSTTSILVQIPLKINLIEGRLNNERFV